MARLTRHLAGWPLGSRARRRLGCLIATAFVARPLAAQGEGLAVDSVRVAVQLQAASARVEEWYWLARTPRVLDFMYLANGCSAVAQVQAARGDLPVALAADTNAPWVSWHDTTDVTVPVDVPVVYRVGYDVTWRGGGRRTLPLVHPGRPLTARAAPVVPLVRVVVEDASGAHQPSFPRLVRESPTRWSAALVAIPSTVVLEGPDAAGGCAPGDAIGGANDGFTRRMALLALTMLLWIPLYFWWAVRRRAGEDEAGTA